MCVQDVRFGQIVKPGGLHSWDESRLRFLNLSRWTFKTRRDFLNNWDVLFFLSQLRFLKSRLFSRDFAWSRFLSRLSRLSRQIEIMETNRDCQDLSRWIKICQEISTLWRHFENENDKKSQWMEKSWQEICKNPLTSQSRLRRTVKKWRNFQVLTNFSILIETFGSGHWCGDKIEKSGSWSRFLNCRDELFENF